MMNTTDDRPKETDAKNDRARRLTKALRDNLRRRKSAEKARAVTTPAEKVPDTEQEG